jgi:hypothetical protein
MRTITRIFPAIIALLALALWPSMSHAYATYSAGKVTNPSGAQESYGNCKTCHGHFRAAEYISRTDHKPWIVTYTALAPGSVPETETGLHDIHRHVILDEDSPESKCQPCHGAAGFYPVILNSSATPYFEPVGCMGCHGRDEDDLAQGSPTPGGRGAGLRQHHTNAGVTECMTCHADADPANYTPVGEDVPPPYYFTPDPVFMNKPTDPCNQHGEENYVGRRKGLDNDGDGAYDTKDPDCKKKKMKR